MWKQRRSSHWSFHISENFVAKSSRTGYCQMVLFIVPHSHHLLSHCCSFARNLPLKSSFRYGVTLYLALRLGQQGSQAKPREITCLQQRGQGASALLPEQRVEVELLPHCLQLLRAEAAKGWSQSAGGGQLQPAAAVPPHLCFLQGWHSDI